MNNPSRGGRVAALLLVMTIGGAGSAYAQEEGDKPAESKPDAGTVTESESETEAEAEAETEAETEAESDAGADDEEVHDSEFDEVIIEYDAEEGHETDDEETDKEEEITPVVTGPQAEVQTEKTPLEPGADKFTGVEGRVISRRPKKALADAPVTARGEDGKVRSTLTDKRGRYKLYLPPGTYTLRSFYDLYHGARWDDIVVHRRKFSQIHFVLDPITAEDAGVEELEVPYMADTSSEAAQLNIRKESVNIQDSISKEEISRVGENTATGAVKRVVGVTIDEEGRIIIRGLGNRYNRILLNNVEVPGVDPDIPSIKLDIFPTEIVSNLGVVKTPRADLPGNFAGGLLLVETSNYPREFTLKASLSLAYNSLSTFKDRPDYQGGTKDWLGFDDGTRSIPGAVGDRKLVVGDDFASSADVIDAAKTFPNDWNPTTKLALPGMAIKLSLGDTHDFKKNLRVGYLAAFLYGAMERIRTGFNRDFNFDSAGNVTNSTESYDFEAGGLDVGWGGFGSIYLQATQDHQLQFNILYSRRSSDTTLLQVGEREDNSILTTKDSFDFTGRSILFNQLSGDHTNLGDTRLRLRWTGFISTGERDQPDRREIQQQVASQRIFKATRFYSKLNQFVAGGKTQLRFPLWQQAYATVGGQADYGTRDLINRRFEYRPITNERLLGDPDVVLGPVGLGTVSTLQETTTDRDSYNASTKLYAGFAMFETPVTEWLKMQAGVRVEVFDQYIQSQSPFADSAIPPEVTDRLDVDPLPSLNGSFKINDRQFIKLGYGMSVVRPAIRELAPYVYIDFLRGWNIKGDPDLQRTRIQNAEARYEFYFGDSDLFAATAFYKNFKDPIEFIVFSPINDTAGFQNAEKAWLVGGELELRFWLGRWTTALKNFYLQGNVAFMGSKTTLPPDQKRSGRPERRLYSQSPYVTNLSLRFDDPDSGVTASLVYNSFGRRIVEVGTSAADFNFPDVFQQPQHLLDLIVSWKPAEDWKLNLKWRNILLETNDFKQGSVLVKRENLGTTISIGFDYIY